MIADLLSGLVVVGIVAACDLVGWACERALSRPVEHGDEAKITVW